MFGLRTDVFAKEPDMADWLLDLLARPGREDDAYHATCVILMEYTNAPPPDGGEDDEDRSVTAGLVPSPGEDDEPLELPEPEVDRALASLPIVRIDHERTPANLSPGTFLTTMVNHVLDVTPVNLHK